MFRLLFSLFLLFNVLNAKEIKNILVLHSYHQSSKWVQNIQRGIEDTLDKTKFEINLYIENMDTKRYSTKEYYNQLKSLYKIKYQDKKLDGIIVSDNNAFDFLIENRDEIFGNIPVSFLGINFFNPKVLNNKSNFTGVLENEYFDANVRLMKLINPDLKTIFIVSDYSDVSLKVKENILNLISKNNYGIKFIFNENKPFDLVLEDISKLEENSAVLIGAYFKDNLENIFEPSYTAQKIVEASSYPVYTMFDWFFNNGVVGGNMISSYEQGKVASNIMNRILNKEDITTIQIEPEGTNKIFLEN